MKKVIISGAGISGLASAVFLEEAGYDVEVYEKTSRIGGRIFSYFDKEAGMYLDNGKHILAGWYENTFRLLRIINAEGNFIYQKGLKLKYVFKNGKKSKLDFSLFPKPFNFIFGLIITDVFTPGEKLLLYQALKKIAGGIADKSLTMKKYLMSLNQSDGLFKYFWEPFAVSAFNTGSENVNISVLSNILKNGIKRKESSSLIVPRYDLKKSIIIPLEKYISNNNIKIFLKNNITDYKVENGLAISAQCGKKTIYGDYFIQAFNHQEIKYSSILAVHFVLAEPLGNEFGNNEFYFLPDSFIDWIFIDTGTLISAVISDCREVKSESDYVNELKNYINGIKIKKVKIILNKYAAYIPDRKSQETIIRRQKTAENVFYAGDASLAGFPSTIETAVRSGMKCTGQIIKMDESGNYGKQT